MENHEYIRTKRIVVDCDEPAVEIVEQAAEIIRGGGLVAFPTETVYGLGADALSALAVKKIFTAKGRPAHDPVIAHVTDLEMLAPLVTMIAPTARLLAERFWPGPLTLVLPRSALVPDVLTAGGPTVAVRAPAHPIARALIRAAATPIAAPSANRFAHTSPTTAQHVLDDLAGRIDMVLDGGPTRIGVESTVLDVSVPVPRLLRPGGVSLEALEAVLGTVELMADNGKIDETMQLASPGLLDIHYAPRADLLLFADGIDPQRFAGAIGAAREEGRKVGVMAADEIIEEVAPVLGNAGDTEYTVLALGSIHDAQSIARRLFSAMRELDARGVDLIVTHGYAPAGLGRAVNDRLRRAATTVID